MGGGGSANLHFMPGSIVPLPHSVRLGRRSADSAIVIA